MTPRLYKAAEVCEMSGLQPYVLRSWEKEFPGIGVQKSHDSARLYRESDIEQVRRIKQLVFGEGLTVAGARRRLEEAMPQPADGGTTAMAEVLDTLDADARTRIDLVRSGLRSILEVLSKRVGAATLAELPRNGAGRRAGTRRSKPAPKGRHSRHSGRTATKSKRAAKRVVARKAKATRRKRASA